ncbi:MAG: exo-beta-N-acetylmuramidase NamZ domain-containing protein, partial [Candidatus Micrarchaeaceae archaeon]
CGGVNLVVVDRDAFDAVRTGLTLASTLRRLYVDRWEPEKLMTLLVNQAVYDRLMAGASYEELASTWSTDLEAFEQRRGQHLLYAA